MQKRYVGLTSSDVEAHELKVRVFPASPHKCGDDSSGARAYMAQKGFKF